MTRPHILTNLSHHSNKLKDQEMLWAASCFVISAGFLMDCVSAHVGKQCREERSINGMALQGFVFKKLFDRAFHECDISCERDITCQSCNFVVGEKSCELNNRTKEARPEHFRSDPARFYMSRLKERGMNKNIRILKVAFYGFFWDSVARATIAWQTSVLIARAEMT